MRIKCSRCSALLVMGSLRCRHCGADARAAPPATDLGVDSSALFTAVERDPLFTAWVNAINRLEEISPAVSTWRRHPIGRSTPRPDAHPRHRAEVDELELEIDQLKAKMDAEWRELQKDRG